MTDVPLIDAMVLWEQNEAGSMVPGGHVVVIDHPSRGRYKELPRSDLACSFGWDKLSNEGRLVTLFSLFVTLTVRDNLAPEKVHEAFLAIPEYRQSLQPDVPGSERQSIFM